MRSLALLATAALCCLPGWLLAQTPPVPKRDLVIHVQCATGVNQPMNFGSAVLEFCFDVLVKKDKNAPEGPGVTCDYYHVACSHNPTPRICVTVDRFSTRGGVANDIAAQIKTFLPASEHHRVTVTGESVWVEGVSTLYFTDLTPVVAGTNSNHPTILRDSIDY